MVEISAKKLSGFESRSQSPDPVGLYRKTVYVAARRIILHEISWKLPTFKVIQYTTVLQYRPTPNKSCQMQQTQQYNLHI